MVPEGGGEKSVIKNFMPTGYPIRTQGVHWRRCRAARYFSRNSQLPASG